MKLTELEKDEKEIDELEAEANRLTAKGVVISIELNCLFHLGHNREEYIQQILELLKNSEKRKEE